MGRSDLLRRLPVYATGDHACPYLDGETACTWFVDPEASLSPGLYSNLIRQGYRRSGSYIYRPGCEDCHACQSLRIPVAAFRPRRRHRRCLKANSGALVQPLPPEYRDEHYRLYCDYLQARHPGSEMADPSIGEYLEFLRADWCETLFYEFRDERDELLGVAVTDLVADGLSAVYTFFRPDLPRRSLGTLGILWQINEAQRLGLSYVYLGYWVAGCESMRYKSDFRPHEVYTGGRWVTVD
ncbi:arginine-tRNA-protein transferase [Alkalispirillum mobile]|uniref:Aspartate/glutamate leucyltransferase n=1 Tax=Alkalispirillum mobile TaxID=85925 RepID=A0A498C4D0_9GAMM|nr:arginyltransferase [Alkalispirillum mobile]RLK50585.1 arginine-tRNA-protein transferase [Alkalispirillum mobile]